MYKVESCAAVIVTYFPSPDNISNIINFSNICELVVIVDNTCTDIIRELNSKNTIIVQNASNIGLSAALNIGIEIAGSKGYENIFLFDQDTTIPDSFFSNMLGYKAECEFKYKSRAIIVPNFFDRNCSTFARYFLLAPFKISHATCKDIKDDFFNHSVIAITSGTLLTYSLYKVIGPLREDYFIDFIDHEYCLRAAKNGIKIIPNCETLMIHSIGTRSVRSRFGITIKPNNHSSARRYYISRNSIRTAIEYFKHYPFYSLLVASFIFHEIFAILIYESSKLQKIKSLFLGILHAFLNKMGEYAFTK